MIGDKVMISHATFESHNIDSCDKVVIHGHSIEFKLYVIYGILWVQLYAPPSSS